MKSAFSQSLGSRLGGYEDAQSTIYGHIHVQSSDTAGLQLARAVSALNSSFV